MKRLTTPNHNYSDLIDLCIEGIADTQAMKPRIIANKQKSTFRCECIRY